MRRDMAWVLWGAHPICRRGGILSAPVVVRIAQAVEAVGFTGFALASFTLQKRAPGEPGLGDKKPGNPLASLQHLGEE